VAISALRKSDIRPASSSGAKTEGGRQNIIDIQTEPVAADRVFLLFAV
jgi:hypothetical protein